MLNTRMYDGGRVVLAGDGRLGFYGGGGGGGGVRG